LNPTDFFSPPSCYSSTAVVVGIKSLQTVQHAGRFILPVFCDASNVDDGIKRFQWVTGRLSVERGSFKVDGDWRYRSLRHATLVHSRYSWQHPRVHCLGSTPHETFIRLLPGRACTRWMHFSRHAGQHHYLFTMHSVPL